jgi:hypothetical protein
MLYDEGGRGIAAERGQQVTLGQDNAKDVKQLVAPDKLEAIDLTKWNKLRVTARGNRLVHRVNGKQTVKVIDNDSKKAEARGLLALQVHAGPPMKVQFRSVKLKRLSDKKSPSPDAAATSER